MKLALLVSLGVLFMVAPAVRAQDDDEDLDAELGGESAPPMTKEEQERAQQEMFIRHLLQTVSEPCRDEIMTVMQMPPEEQKAKGLSAECNAEVNGVVEELRKRQQPQGGAADAAAGAGEEEYEAPPPPPKKEKASKTPKPARAKKAKPEDTENFLVGLQVSLVLLAAVGGFVVYVYSTYKPAPPKAEAEAPLSRKAAKAAAKAAGVKRA